MNLVVYFIICDANVNQILYSPTIIFEINFK